ncbi:MAG: SWIM zinc finger family protein [Acidobacteria bacterium]|nr:SWIM zinc finger family protein [Acidobacteriota bacterium]
MSYWNYYPKPSKPREAKGGIKAKSKRGDIGETWWSKRFIKLLESFDLGGRLTRGKTYARKGQVLNLGIEPGEVTAKVQGSARTPYKVSIRIQPFTERQWQDVEIALAQQALFMAKLLNNEMPNEIEQAFNACGLNLFPASAREIKTNCSCPDSSNPCKHIAAVYYILAEKFDEDPFEIFFWRGRSQEKLITNLRNLRGADDEPDPTPEPIIEAVEQFIPLPQTLNNFWDMGESAARLQFKPQATKVPDAILKQLDPLPLEISGVPVTDILSELYEVFTSQAEKKAFSE